MTKAAAFAEAKARRANGEDVKVYCNNFINPRTGIISRTYFVK